jgi:uncharacterized protein (TIGR03083 family)
MTAARPAASLFGGVALLERAVSYTLGQLQAVTPAALARPTPCRQWDLRALLAHMDDSLAAMQEAMELGNVDLDPGPAPPSPGDLAARVAGGPGGLAPGDPAAALVAGLRARGCRLLEALTGGNPDPVWIDGYPVPVRIVASAGAIDVAVHGWDVARACGRAGTIPGQLAGDMLRTAPLLVTGADRPWRFGPPVAVPPDASASDRLVGYLGRNPRWHGHHHVA